MLVVFNTEIRDDILVEDPKDRQFFTHTQTKLVRGYPRKDGDQDTLEEVLTLSDTELKFWKSVGIDPYYMYVSGTIDLVDTDYVQKNRELLNSFDENEVKKVIPNRQIVLPKPKVEIPTNQQSLNFG